MLRHELDSSGSVLGQVAVSCECGNEPSGYAILRRPWPTGAVKP